MRAGFVQTALAEKLGLRMNGHALVWRSHCPDWYFKDVDVLPRQGSGADAGQTE